MTEIPSPYRYIGTNKAGQRVVRTDLILLDALSKMEGNTSSEALLEFADPRNQARMSPKSAIALLVEMLADGLVDNEGGSLGPRWKITERGRAHLISAEAEEIFEDLARFTHLKPEKLRIEEAPHPISLNDRLRASHAELDRQGVPAAIEKLEKKRSEKVQKFLELLRDPDLSDYTRLLRLVLPVTGVAGAAGTLQPATEGGVL